MKDNHILLMSTHILQLAKDTCDEIILLQEGILRPLDSLRKGEIDFDDYIVKELSKGA